MNIQDATQSISNRYVHSEVELLANGTLPSDGSPLDETSDAGADGSSATALFLEGDIAAQVAALAIRTAKEQRDANSQIRSAEEAGLQREEAAQVAAMHDQADDIRAAGIVDGCFTASSGACMFFGSLATSSAVRESWQAAAKFGHRRRRQ